MVCRLMDSRVRWRAVVVGVYDTDGGNFFVTRGDRNSFTSLCYGTGTVNRAQGNKSSQRFFEVSVYGRGPR